MRPFIHVSRFKLLHVFDGDAAIEKQRDQQTEYCVSMVHGVGAFKQVR